MKNFQFSIFNFQEGLPRSKRSFASGFTLIEIVIVIVIIMITTTIVSVSFNKLNASQALDKGANLVVSTLEEARALTLSSKGDTQYGVHLEDDKMVLFKGDTYSSSDATNVVTSLNSIIGISNITLSGAGSSIVFERLTGDTDEAGTMRVYLRASPGTFRTITVSNTGVVELD